MSNSTFQGVLRSGPKGSSVYAGSVLLVAEISLDPSAASATTGVTLPAGAVVVDVIGNGGGTGGSSPTFAVGTSANNDAFVDDMVADSVKSAVAEAKLGASVLAALSEDTLVYAGAGDTGTDATGGTVLAKIMYYRLDSTSGVNQ